MESRLSLSMCMHMQCVQGPLHQFLVLGRQEEEGLEGFSLVGISLLMFAELPLLAGSSLISPLTSSLISLLVPN